MVQEKLSQLVATQVSVAVAVELQQSSRQLFGGHHFALAESAAEFDRKVQAGHALFGVHHHKRVRPVARRVYTRGVKMGRRHLPAAVAGVMATLLGCASGPVRPDPAPFVLTDISWSALTARAEELLQRLVAIDTTQPRGAGRDAAQVLQAFLRRESVQTELINIGDGRWAVWGRVEAVDAKGPPVVLLSHLDTASVDPAAWPRETPPRSLTIREGRMWGAGVADGKGLAVLHATSLAVLAELGGPRKRDVHLVALPDALDLGANSLDALIATAPAIATATVALTGGGCDVVDWFGDGRRVQAVSVGERATAVIQVATVNRSDGQGPPSSERLAQALVAIRDRPRQPRLTATNRATLRASAEGLSIPQRLLLGSRIGVRYFVVPELIDRPGLGAQFLDNVRILRIEAGLRGDTSTRTTASPYRSRALLRASLLEDSTPGSFIGELRKAVDDPDVHFTVKVASPLSTSGASNRWLDRIRRGARATDDSVTVPILSDHPQGAVPLRLIGVPVFGYIPWARTPQDLRSDRPRPVGEEEFRNAVQRMTILVANLSAQ